MSFRDRWNGFFYPERLTVLPPPLPSFNNLLPFANVNGRMYPMQTLMGEPQSLSGDFVSLVQGAYKANGIVWACEMARINLFSEARFMFRQLRKGKPGDLFGTSDLRILEHPWPKATTGDLLARMLLYADFGDTCVVLRRAGALRPLRPDWVAFVIGSEQNADMAAWDVDADIIGIAYQPGGPHGGRPLEYHLADEFAVFAPTSDPTLPPGLGTGWVKTVISEIMGDKAATAHKLKFYENGATVNLLITVDPKYNDEQIGALRKQIDTKHTGLANAYSTLILRAAVENATPIGKDFQQIDFKVVQGAGETRIAAAAQCGPIVAQLSEGQQGSALSSGNFQPAMRRFADLWARPTWRNVAGSLEAIVPPPPGSHLWYDDRDIPALKDDIKDAAVVQSTQAISIETLIRAGFKADDAVVAITGNDLSILEGAHTGLFSVQLQAPGSTKMPQGEVPGETPVGGGTALEVPAVNPAKPTPASPTAAGNGRSAAVELLAPFIGKEP